MRTHQVQEGVGQRVVALQSVSVKRPKQDVDPQLPGGELVNGAVFEAEVQFVQATSGRVNGGVRVVVYVYGLSTYMLTRRMAVRGESRKRRGLRYRSLS